MKTVKETAKAYSLHNLFFDAYLCFAFWVFLTGGAFFIRDGLQDLIDQKPWIHRLAIAIVTLAAWSWSIYRAQKRAGVRLSPLTAFLHRISPKPIVWVWLLFGLSSLTWTWSSWVRHDVFRSSFDMAIFVQSVWNTLQGHFLYSSIKGGICLLGDHFSPILAVFALPYAVWPDPKCLLLLQAVAAASSVFPLYLIARDKLDHSGLAALFAFALIFYLPLRNSVRFDFHPEVAAMPLFFWAFYFMAKRQMFYSSSFLLVVLMAKETAALVTFAFGVYAFLFIKKRLWGLFWIGFSVFYFFLIIKVAIPYFSGKEYFYLSGNIEAWTQKGLRPFLQHVFSKESAGYLVKILGPAGFLSLLNPAAFLLTLPMFAQNLFSRNEAVRSIFFQYTAFLTPFVFISAVYGSARLLAKKHLLVYYLVFCTLLFTGISEYYVISRHQALAEKGDEEVRRYLRSIPPELSVRTHEFFAPHAAHRKELHIYENTHPLEGGRPEALDSDIVALDERFLGAIPEHAFDELIESGYQETHRFAAFRVYRLAATLNISDEELDES